MGPKTESCNRHFPLERRKLFAATVSQTLLYGAGAWNLKEERLQKLWAAQRRMLRSMVARRGTRPKKRKRGKRKITSRGRGRG